MSGKRSFPNYMPIVVGLTVVINLAVAVLFFLPGYEGASHLDLRFMPLMNAVFNSFTFVFLVLALAAIRRKEIEKHRKWIFAAFTSTALFLVTYVTYHFLTESTKYGGEGLLRSIYFFVLLTHIVLAIVIVPLALISVFSGLGMQVEKHRRISKWTMPIWLYVSFTGVLVYVMIRPYY